MDSQKIADLDRKLKQLKQKVSLYQDLQCDRSYLEYDIADLKSDMDIMKDRLGEIKLKLDSLRILVNTLSRKLDDQSNIDKPTWKSKQTKNVTGTKKRKAEKDEIGAKKLKDVDLPECKDDTVISTE